MTAPTKISRIGLAAVGFLLLGALSFVFVCLASFGLAYAVEIAPAVQGLGSIEEAGQLLDSVCMTFPSSIEDLLAAVSGSLGASG